MKNSFLKYPSYAFYATALAIIAIANLQAADQSRADLLIQLIERLGPEKAAEFMARLEQKHGQAMPKIPQVPQAPVVRQPTEQEPVIIETPAPAPVVVPDPVVVPEPDPVKKPVAGISAEDRHHFDYIINKLETYAQGVYKTIEAFFSKRNFDPYTHHVQNFKNQLQYLNEELIHQYPQAQSAEGIKLFKALEVIALSLQKAQETMVQTLDMDYGTGMFSGAKLGTTLLNMKPMADSQQAIINKEIGDIRNQLRNAHEQDMLKKINTLFTVLNKNFDYHKNKNSMELYSILNHRTKR